MDPIEEIKEAWNRSIASYNKLYLDKEECETQLDTAVKALESMKEFVVSVEQTVAIAIGYDKNIDLPLLQNELDIRILEVNETLKQLKGGSNYGPHRRD